MHQSIPLMRFWVRFWLIGLCCYLPFSAGHPIDGFVSKRKIAGGDKIPVSYLYSSVPLNNIPTTVADDVVLFNRTDTRYGYFIGRPVERIIRNPIVKKLKPLISAVLGSTPPLMHWGVLISKEPPVQDLSQLPKSGDLVVQRPVNGTVFELRNSGNTGLVYLDVKNWPTYVYRLDTVKYLGTLNKTDEELLYIGRVFIRHIGQHGFHNFFRNCQVFATWFSKEIWPDAFLATRADQFAGKCLWWWVDPKKTLRVGKKKLLELFGYETNEIEDLDIRNQFKPVKELVEMNSQQAAIGR